MDDLRITPYPLRMDDDLRDMLQSAADSNNRPLSQEIIRRLTDSFDNDKSTADASLLAAKLERIENTQKEILSLLKVEK